MGSIRKRGENSWEITINVGRDPVTGKRKRIYKVKGTKTEAKKEMVKLEYEIETGQYIEPSKLTLKEFLHRWYEDYCVNNLAASTLEYYNMIINTHIVPILGNIKISDLKPMHIQSYISEKLKNGRKDGKSGGLSKKSVKRHYTTLHKALDDAVK